LSSSPHNPITQVNLACALHAQGQLDEAIDLLLTVLAKDPSNVEALNNLGVIQQRMDDCVAAVETYQLALEHAPFHAEAIKNLEVALTKMDAIDAPLIYPRMLVEKLPQDDKAWVILAIALKQNDQSGEAFKAIQTAIRLAPQNPYAHFIQAALYKNSKNIAASLSSMKAAVSLSPQNIDYLVELGLTSLQSGDASSAIQAFDAVLALDRFEQRALAYRPVALRIRGDIAADAYTDPNEVAIVIKLPAPAGYKDIQSYLAMLADDLRAISQRTWMPKGQSVRGGTQTEQELFMEKSESIQALRRTLDQIIPEYFKIRRQDAEHPFYGCVPSRISYRSWSIVTRKGGYHVPHIHPEGCLSGVFYVALPELKGEEGCLELGRPGINNLVLQPPEAPKRLIRPMPGNLVLFPSYLWHGTLPFEDDGERITIAFDIVRTH
jgi:tetratricopeptide (TPR) repeat protein